MSRKPPRWTIAFLRALERTGAVEAAARDAGIDKSTAYARRKAHGDFAEAWEAALARREGVVVAEVKERTGFWERVKKGLLPAPSPGSAAAESSREGRGAAKEELLATSALGGKVVRAGPGRWNQAAEKLFFDELAASANVRRACAAAGVSTNAVYARRMKRPDFRAKWDAVLETGRAAIEMHLVESARQSFDPDDLDLEGARPKVLVAEAIRIIKLHASRANRQAIEEIDPPEHEVAAIRERLVEKLQRMRDRMMPQWLAEGWSYDEAHDHMVPPGWVRADGGAP